MLISMVKMMVKPIVILFHFIHSLFGELLASRTQTNQTIFIIRFENPHIHPVVDVAPQSTGMPIDEGSASEHPNGQPPRNGRG